MSKVKNIKELVKKLRYDASTQMYDRIFDSILQEHNRLDQHKSTVNQPNTWKFILGSRVGSLAAAFLIISSLITCFILSNKNADLKNELELAQRDITAAPIDDSVTINFYLKEHQDTIARYASHDSAALQPMQMQINQDDLLYFELFGNQPEFLSPGIFVRRPPFQHQINSSDTPTVSNGHALTLSEARETADFDFVSPTWLNPGYMFDQIKRIEDRDTLHLIYTDSINTLSLFEQPLDGQRGLSPQDFREYAVYQNEGQTGGIILTWRDNALSYILIGNAEMSQLIEIAQTINANNGRK